MSTNELRRVLIAGCGVAGPTLGLFLRRLELEVVICEARPALARDEGAFLGVAPNGMNVLAQLGIAPEVAAIAVPCHGFELRNARDRVVATIDRRNDAARFGARLEMVRRADLHQVLARSAERRGVRIHFGRALSDLPRNDDSGVVARFDDAEESGDALIGCDGLHSRARELVLGEPLLPAYSGLIDIAGFAQFPRVPLEPGVNVMVFGRRAFFGAFKTPGGEVWWFHNRAEQNAQYRSISADAERARLLEVHADDPPWIRHVIQTTPALLGPYALHDVLTLPRWSRGRICLIGDAAHATTPSAGQGASLAIEDAIVLAQALRDLRDPTHAFAAFERARRGRVEAIVKQSRRNGSLKSVPGPLQEWFRDRLLPLFLKLGTSAQERQYEHRIPWETSIAC